MPAGAAAKPASKIGNLFNTAVVASAYCCSCTPTAYSLKCRFGTNHRDHPHHEKVAINPFKRQCDFLLETGQKLVDLRSNLSTSSWKDAEKNTASFREDIECFWHCQCEDHVSINSASLDVNSAA